MSKEVASNRIAVTPDTHKRLKDFSNGLGVSQDKAINILLNLALQYRSNNYSSPELIAGLSLREELLEAESENVLEAS